MVRETGYYRVTCWQCSHTVELPATDGQHTCTTCGAGLTVEWNGERARLEAESRP